MDVQALEKAVAQESSRLIQRFGRFDRIADEQAERRA